MTLAKLRSVQYSRCGSLHAWYLRKRESSNRGRGSRCWGIKGAAGARGCARLVLEEVVVEVALEAAREGDGAGRPAHGVAELHVHARHDRLRVLARQVHLDDLRAASSGALSRRALHAPAGHCPAPQNWRIMSGLVVAWCHSQRMPLGS